MGVRSLSSFNAVKVFVYGSISFTHNFSHSLKSHLNIRNFSRRGVTCYAPTEAIQHEFPNGFLRLPMGLLAHFIAGAQLGMMTWWLANPKHYPPETIAKLAQTLTMSGLQWGMGLDTLNLPRFSEGKAKGQIQ